MQMASTAIQPMSQSQMPPMTLPQMSPPSYSEPQYQSLQPMGSGLAQFSASDFEMREPLQAAQASMVQPVAEPPRMVQTTLSQLTAAKAVDDPVATTNSRSIGPIFKPVP